MEGLGAGPSDWWPGWAKLISFGGWYGNCTDRSEETTAEVRLKRVSGTEAISRTFIAVTEEDGVVTGVEPVTLTIAEADPPATESQPYLLTVSTDATGKLVKKRLLPVEMEALPAQEAIVSADMHSIDLSAEVLIGPSAEVGTVFDEHEIMEATVEWSVTQGSGSLSEAVSTLTFDEPAGETTLTTSTNAGDEFVAQVRLTSITIGDEDEPEEWQTFSLGDGLTQKTGKIIVGPGGAADLTHTITAATGPGGQMAMMPDGQSTRTIQVMLKDSFGNTVAEGTPVDWKMLSGDGHLEQAVTLTDADGQATAVLRSGRIGGLPIVVGVRADELAAQIEFSQTAYTAGTFNLVTGPLLDGGGMRSFVVTANVSAADGAWMRWQTTRGTLSNATTLQDGTATATITVGPEDEGQLAVVTAAVGNTVCLVSKRLSTGGSAATIYDFVVNCPGQAGQAVTLDFIHSPPPAGVAVYVGEESTTPLSLPQDATADASGSLFGRIVLPDATIPAELIRLHALKNGTPVSGCTCLLFPHVADGGGPPDISTLSEQARTVAEHASELQTGAYYSNLPGGQVPAEEAAELTREAIEDARQLFDPQTPQNPPPVNEVPSVADLAPLALGGDLAHQASDALKLTELAAAINGACDNALAVARELDGMGDDDGAQVAQVHNATSNWSWLRAAMPSGLDWHPVVYQKADEYHGKLRSASGEALRAAVHAAKAFDHWEMLEKISGEIGVLPYIEDAHTLISVLDEEAFINLIKALARYSESMARDPGATALATIQTADPWLAQKINGWAAQGGEEAQVIAATAGLYSQMLQNGAMLAAAAGSPGKSFKRMAGQMIGTVSAAAMGSEEAQNELKEMVPFYSWLLLGEKINTKWEAHDYYGAGKEAWNIALQVAGDVTIFLPVIKGAAAGVKLVGQELKVALQPMLKKSGQGFVKNRRNSITDVPGQVKRRIGECSDGLQCFPAGTLVLMADGGTKPIEEIRDGEYVMADDPTDASPPTARQVTKTVNHWTQSLMEMQTDHDGDGQPDGSFRATPNHPMWIIGSGWTQAGDIRTGDSLLDAAGTSVPVVTASAFNLTCNTYNLGVADDHSFFVLSGETPVLAHNTNVGPRAWIIYQAEMLGPDGVTYTYTGKASMQSTEKSFDPKEVFNQRYSKTKGGLRRKTKHGMLERDFDNVRILHQFWEDGSPSNIASRSSDRLRTKGEVTAHALEAYEEFKWRENGQSVNIHRPLSGKHPQFDDILDVGETYLQSRNNNTPCAGLVRIR